MTTKSTSGLSFGLDIWSQSTVKLEGNKNSIISTSTTNKACAVSINEQSNIDFGHGTTVINAKSTSGLVVGVGSYSNSQASFINSQATINVASETGRSVGVTAEGGTLEFNDAVINLNASGTFTDPSATSIRYMEGIHAANGAINAAGSITFNITTVDSNGQLIDAGDQTTIRGVGLEGSAYNTNVSIDRDLTINVNSNVGEVRGVYVSGDRSSTEDLHAGLTVNGTLAVNITGNNKNVTAVHAQGESGVEASRITTTIRSEGTASQITGITSTTNPSSYPGPGKVIAYDGYTASIEGVGNLYGLRSEGMFDDRASIIQLGGSSSITLNSTDGSATALKVVGGAISSVSSLTTSVTAKTDAIGLLLEEGTLTLTGSNNILIKGETSSVGLKASSGSTLNISDHTYISAQTALSQDESSSIVVGSSSNAPSILVLDGAVENEGQILLQNATLSINGNSHGNFTLGSIAAESESIIDLGAGTYQIANLTGDETKTLRLNDLTASVRVASATGATTLAASGLANDTATDAYAAAQALINAVEIQTPTQDFEQTLVIEEGLINDRLTASVDSDGNLFNVTQTKNSKLTDLTAITSLSLISWRHEASDLFKRMGELRDLPQGMGLWVRAYGSEQSYSSQGLEQHNTSIQVGADSDIGAGWKVGAAFSYTDSSSSYDKGSADGKSYSAAIYGTWLGDNGYFVDVIARYGRISNDFNVDVLNGTYDNNAFSVSAEYGRRYELTAGAFIEPQIELSYSQVMGDEFYAGSNISVNQDDFKSLVGRIGLRSGLQFPEKKGAIQAKFSVLNEFCGEFDAFATNGIARNTLHDDVGGVWIEYGVGGYYKLGGRTQGYLDLERTSGGDIDANWRWSIGLRHVW